MKRARGLALLGLGALLGSACGEQHLGPPPSAPSLVRATDAIPADLDLVLRLDLRKMRETLGGPAMTALGEEAVKSLRGDDRETDALLLHALEQTDTLWLGLRPTSTLSVADSVFVMVGHFPHFDPHRAASTPRFGPALDLGGDLRRYDRPHPATRSAPARIYARGDDWLVSVSEAEIDSVERSLEEQRGMPPLEPAEKGTFSAVARPQVLPLAILAGTESLRRVVSNANRLELNAELNAAGLDATLALKFEDALLAEQVARALNEMHDALAADSGRLAKLVTRTKIGSAGQYVSLRLALGRDELSELVNCRGSACGW